MEIKNDEKNPKLSSALKKKMNKRFEKIKNQSKHNLDSKEFKTLSENNEKAQNLYPIKSKKDFNMIKENGRLTNYNFDNILNLNKNLIKLRNEDYNNDLNNPFYTTSKVIKKQKFLKRKKPSINIANYNGNLENSVKEKNKVLNKLFPDIYEINKYSNLPFFSFIKMKRPYKTEVNREEKMRKLPQEKFLYKISHNIDEEKINNNNFNKNKGIKKGTTVQYFHGVDKFCINNKVSETNFYREDLNKKEKLELDINNLGGEKIPQINNKERHLKILEDNLKSLKSMPNKLMNELEDGVFKFIDEEFDNLNNDEDELNNKIKKISEYKKKLSSTPRPDDIINNKSTSTNNINNIINLINQFKINNLKDSDKLLITTQYFSQNRSKIKRINDNIDNSNYSSTGFKKPLKYPINFYSTQQIKKKERFSNTHKNTFEERAKRIQKEYQENEKNKIKQQSQLVFDANSLQKRRKVMTNGYAYKKETKIRDIIIGHKLKCEFSPIDIKRVLNGLKPWVDIKLDEERNAAGNSGDKKVNENKAE